MFEIIIELLILALIIFLTKREEKNKKLKEKPKKDNNESNKILESNEAEKIDDNTYLHGDLKDTEKIKPYIKNNVISSAKKILPYFFNILLTLTIIDVVSTYCDNLSFAVGELIALGLLVLVYIIENILFNKNENKEIINSVAITTVVSIAILHFGSVIRHILHMTSLPTYVYSIVQIPILLVISLRTKESTKAGLAALITIYFLATGVSIFFRLEYSYHIYMIFGFLTFLVTELFRKKSPKITAYISAVTHIFIGILYIYILAIHFNDFSTNALYSILLFGLYIYSYISNKTPFSKYLAYIVLDFALYNFLKSYNIEMQYISYVPMIATIIAMGIETLFKKFKDKFNNAYFIIFQIIAFLRIYFSSKFSGNSNVALIMAVIFAICCILYWIYVIKKNKKLN